MSVWGSRTRRPGFPGFWHVLYGVQDMLHVLRCCCTRLVVAGLTDTPSIDPQQGATLATGDGAPIWIRKVLALGISGWVGRHAGRRSVGHMAGGTFDVVLPVRSVERDRRRDYESTRPSRIVTLGTVSTLAEGVRRHVSVGEYCIARVGGGTVRWRRNRCPDRRCPLCRRNKSGSGERCFRQSTASLHRAYCSYAPIAGFTPNRWPDSYFGRLPAFLGIGKRDFLAIDA